MNEEEFAQDREEFRAYTRENSSVLNLMKDPSLPQEAEPDLSRAVLLREGHRVLVRIPVSAKAPAAKGWQSLYLTDYPRQADVLAQVWQPLVSAIPGGASKRVESLRQEVMRFLRNWVGAWESRDVDHYMAFYDKGFRAYGMNYRRWRDYKAKLAHKYQAIDVQISRISIKIKRGKANVTFHQVYVSDQFQDVGLKTLKLRRENGRWKIWREDWRPDESMEARR